MAKRKRNEPESTHEPTDLQPQELLRAVMDITISELKLGHDPWRKLAHEKQDQIIERVASRSKDLLRQLLSLISSEGFQRVQVMIEQVTIKDGIKAQVSLSKGEAGWEHLCSAQGQLCTLVLVNAEQFTGVPHGFAAELDQLPLPLPTANASVTDVAEAANDGGDGPDVREAEPVTQEQIDAANQAIEDARAAHIAAGGSDDTLDLSELTSKRDLLVLAYAQQQAMNPAYLAEQIANLSSQIEALEEAHENDTTEILALADQRSALIEQLHALQQPTPTADDLAALDAEIEAAREASGGFVETPEVTALLERRKAMAEAIQAEPEPVAKAA